MAKGSISPANASLITALRHVRISLDEALHQQKKQDKS